MRNVTPDKVEGTRKTITVQRCCNGCGKPIGDADDADMGAAVAGLPLPDVRAECSTCAPLIAALADPQGHALVQAIHDRKLNR